MWAEGPPSELSGIAHIVCRPDWLLSECRVVPQLCLWNSPIEA